MIRQLHRLAYGRGEEGFVLLEIMASIALLGIFLGLLGSSVQRACDAAMALRDKAPALSGSSCERSYEEAWRWGPQIESVTWSPGPRLMMTPGQECALGGEIGAWADGWQIGEWPVTSSTAIEVGGATWDGRAGGELVVRARAGEGPWGPPYRSVIPDAYGNVVQTNATAVETDSFATGFRDAGTVSHSPSVGTASVVASWSEMPVAGAIEDLILILEASSKGLSVLDRSGRIQSWVSSEDRGIDVFW